MADKLSRKMQREFSVKQQWWQEVDKLNRLLHRFEDKGIKFPKFYDEPPEEYTPEAVADVRRTILLTMSAGLIEELGEAGYQEYLNRIKSKEGDLHYQLTRAIYDSEVLNRSPDIETILGMVE